ncbi:MAG: sigma factor [Planctomycetota bacterium]
MPEYPDSKDPTIDFESISILIPRFRAGDQDALEQLVIQVQQYLKLMAANNMDRTLQQKIGASDVVQRTLVRVVENFDQFRGGSGGEFRAWLKKIVSNEIKYLQRAYRAEKRDIKREQYFDQRPSKLARRPSGTGRPEPDPFQ